MKHSSTTGYYKYEDLENNYLKKVQCLVSLIFQQRKMSAVTQVDTNNLLDALSGPNDKASLLIEW